MEPKNKNLYWLAVSTVFSSLASSLFWVVLPLYMWDIGMGFYDIGLMYAAQSGVMVIFARFFGILADKTKKKPYIVAGSTVEAIAILFMIIAVKKKILNLVVFVLFSAATGMGWAIGSGAFAAAITTALSRKKTGHATGIFLSSDAVGWTLGSFVSGLIIDTFGFDAVLLVALSSKIFSAIVVLVGFTELLSGDYSISRAFRDSWTFELRGDTSLIFVLATIVLTSLGASIYFLVFIIKFYVILGSKSLYGYMSGLAGVLGIIMPYVVGKYGDNYKEEILFFTLLVRVAFMLYMSFSWDRIMAIIFWLVPLWGPINTVLIALTTDYAWEGYESEVQAIRNILTQTAMTIGSLIGGLLSDLYGVSINLERAYIILVVGSAFYGLGLVFSMFLLLRKGAVRS